MITHSRPVGGIALSRKSKIFRLMGTAQPFLFVLVRLYSCFVLGRSQFFFCVGIPALLRNHHFINFFLYARDIGCCLTCLI